MTHLLSSQVSAWWPVHRLCGGFPHRFQPLAPRVPTEILTQEKRKGLHSVIKQQQAQFDKLIVPTKYFKMELSMAMSDKP